MASESEGSEEEFRPDKATGSSEEEDEEAVVSSTEEEMESEPDSPIKPVKRKRPVEQPSATPKPRAPQGPSRASPMASTKTRLSAFSAPDNVEGPAGGAEGGVWDHEKLEWLQAGRRKDACKRRQSDEEYDPTTLYVPEDFLNRTTPGMRRWWQLKAEMFDAVLFYKVGVRDRYRV